MASIWSDLRLALRGLRRAPGFSLAVMVALALGIGPNTLVLLAVTATACYLPARRGSAVDPMIALRQE